MASEFDNSLFEDTPYVAPEDMDDSLFEDTPVKEPTMSQPQAALEGAKQGLTMGFADELGGVMGSGMEGLSQSPEEGESKTEQLKRLYEEYREFNRGKAKTAEEEHPGTFMAADIAASMAIPVPGVGAVKAAGKAIAPLGKALKARKGISKVGQAAVAGGATGAVEAAGRTEEDLMSKQGAADVLAGAGAGGILGGVFGKLLGKKSPEELIELAKESEKKANIAALKGVGAKKKDIAEELGIKSKKRATADTAKGAGKTLLDEDVLKTKQSAEGVKAAIVDKLDEVATERMGPTAEKLDQLVEEVPLNTFSDDIFNLVQKVEDDMKDLADKYEFAKTDDKKLYEDMLENRRKIMENVRFALGSPNKVSELVALKRKLQNQVKNWNDPQANAYNEFLVKMQSNISDTINGISLKVDPNLGQEMVKANKVYGDLIRVNSIAGEELARELASNKSLTFKEYLSSGVVSQATGVPGLGPGIIAAKRGMEKATGKDMGKLLNTLEAFQETKKAQKLIKKAGDYVEPDLVKRAVKGVAGASAVVDEQKAKEPYEVQRNAAMFVEKSSKEDLMEAASNISNEYGKAGEKLSATLVKISERPEQERRPLIFSLMQDPLNRKMLGIGKKAEPVPGGNTPTGF